MFFKRIRKMIAKKRSTEKSTDNNPTVINTNEATNFEIASNETIKNKVQSKSRSSRLNLLSCFGCSSKRIIKSTIVDREDDVTNEQSIDKSTEAKRDFIDFNVSNYPDNEYHIGIDHKVT